MFQNRRRLRLCPRPHWEAYSASPELPAGFRRETRERPGEKRKKTLPIWSMNSATTSSPLSRRPTAPTTLWSVCGDVNCLLSNPRTPLHSTHTRQSDPDPVPRHRSVRTRNTLSPVTPVFAVLNFLDSCTSTMLVYIQYRSPGCIDIPFIV